MYIWGSAANPAESWNSWGEAWSLTFLGIPLIPVHGNPKRGRSATDRKSEIRSDLHEILLRDFWRGIPQNLDSLFDYTSTLMISSVIIPDIIPDIIPLGTETDDGEGHPESEKSDESASRPI
jgi:hypothetical protein